MRRDAVSLLVIILLAGCATAHRGEYGRAGLTKIFNERTGDEKLPAAVGLIRMGATEPYRGFISASVERALGYEASAAAVWRTVAGASADPKSREPDARWLLPIVALSMTATRGDEDALDQLRRALKSDNILMSAEAALGLARVKDYASVAAIAEASSRFDESFLFGRALVYFGTKEADALAARLSDDAELLDELMASARDRAYDPYQ